MSLIKPMLKKLLSKLPSALAISLVFVGGLAFAGNYANIAVVGSSSNPSAAIGVTGNPSTAIVTNTSGTNGILIQHSGTGVTATINSTANDSALEIAGNANEIKLEISGQGDTTSNTIQVISDSLTTGGIFSGTSNSADTSTRILSRWHNDNAAATGTTVMTLDQDSTGLALEANGNIDVSGSIFGSSTTSIGWTIQTTANQACNTTCTSACVFGQDNGIVGVLNSSVVACTDATADTCLCAGAS